MAFEVRSATVQRRAHCAGSIQGGTATMAGRFEILRDGEDGYRFRLTASDGTLVAESPRFKHLKAVVAGINAVRENAATGIVVDHSKPARRAA
ncbi:YegP family protein [Arthrobacter bambusae]|uniref:YegP family protein n=1 Tax=unclassified Arthrobacter TaxID=235627 RepID=UPI0033060B02